VFSAGNGEVELYEMSITPKWEGKTIAELLGDCKDTVCAALTRAGRAELPTPAAVLRNGDVLTVSATLDGVKILRSRIQEG